MLNWILAARLRTLPLSLSGVILGSMVARWKLNSNGEPWSKEIFILAIIVTLLYQILSNYANDYGDGIKGTDKKRISEAETRVVSSGKISPKQMKKAIIVLSILSFVFTVLLLWLSFIPEHKQSFLVFVCLGISCVFAALGYTVGKKPYGYIGLGDIFVFVFFGLVSVMGSYYLFTKSFDYQMLLPASAVGFFSVAVLNLNNIRDIDTDAKSGKHTLALRLGFRNAIVYEVILLHLPLILVLIYMMINEIRNYYAYIFVILFFPMMTVRRKLLEVRDSRDIDGFLKQVSVLCLAMSVLIGIGLNIIK